jgi:hypothetical protein
MRAGEIGGHAQLHQVVPAALLTRGVERLGIEAAIGADEDCPAPAVRQPGHALRDELHGVRAGARVAGPQPTVDDHPALALATEQRVVRGTVPLVRVGARAGALLRAVDRLDGRVAVQRVPRLLGERLPHEPLAHGAQPPQHPGRVEPSEVAIEQRVIRQPLAIPLRAQQRLLLEVGEVPDALDTEQVAVEQMPQGLGQRGGRPRRFLVGESLGQRGVDADGAHEVGR